MRRERKSIKSRADNVLGGRQPFGGRERASSRQQASNCEQQQQRTSTLGAREAAAAAVAAASFSLHFFLTEWVETLTSLTAATLYRQSRIVKVLLCVCVCVWRGSKMKWESMKNNHAPTSPGRPKMCYLQKLLGRCLAKMF